MNRIGMIGLGKMGHSIARNIMKQGFPMVLFDVQPKSMEDLVQDGAEAAPNICELGQRAEIVLLMVNTYQQCRSCLLELMKGMTTGTVIVGSTISMDEVQDLEKITAVKGIDMLDAPVSGGTAGALAGTLTIMAGGPKSVFERCLPLLHAYGSNPIHVGEQVGHGQAVKAVNQLLVGINLCATAEAFNMARKCGLDLNIMFSTVKASAGTSRIFENRGQYLIDRDFTTRSTLQIQVKDTNIACHTAEKAGAPVLLGNLCRQLFELAVNQYEPTEDSIAVIKLMENLCGLEIGV